MARPILHLPKTDTADQCQALRAAVTWGATLELTDEQRDELQPHCAKISATVPRTVPQSAGSARLPRSGLPSLK